MTVSGPAAVRIDLRAASAADPVSVELIAELDSELRQFYEPHQMFGLHPGEAEDPRLRFFHLMLDGEVIGCGAYRLLYGDIAELKRMYLRPAHRGAGTSRELLRALEASAIESGVRTMRLETGPFQHAALALYEKSGYGRISAYGEYVASDTSICMEKSLEVPQRERAPESPEPVT